MQNQAIFLMGPTAVGKTELAKQLTQELPVDLISVDSAMVYRGMDIGTGKPSAEELARFPHKLLDICDPSYAYSSAQFCIDATVAMQQSWQQKRIPLLVGGTMLYFKALQFGLSDLPKADPTLRVVLASEAEDLGWPAMHSKLATLDPLAAQQLNPNDAQRIQRALEINILTGKTLQENYQIVNSLLGAIEKSLPKDFKAKFVERLVADITANPGLYSAQILKSLYEHHLACRDVAHINAQYHKFLDYRRAKGQFNAIICINGKNLVTPEMLTILWEEAADPETLIIQSSMKKLASINFARTNPRLDDDTIAEFEILIQKMNALWQKSLKQKAFFKKITCDIDASSIKPIAALVKQCAEAQCNWWTGSTPVRFKIQEFRRSSDGELVKAGKLYISIRLDSSLFERKYTVYNPNQSDDILFADTDAGLLALAKYLLSECNKAAGANQSNSVQQIIRFTQYVPANAHLNSPILMFRRNSSQVQMPTASPPPSPPHRANSLPPNFTFTPKAEKRSEEELFAPQQHLVSQQRQLGAESSSDSDEEEVFVPQSFAPNVPRL